MLVVMLFMASGCGKDNVITSKDAEIEYTVLDQYKVHDQKDSFGAVIVIDGDVDQEDIIKLCQDLSGKYPVVNVKIYGDLESYQAIEVYGEWDKVCNTGLIGNYLKHGEYSKFKWMQRIGDFAEMFGEDIEI